MVLLQRACQPRAGPLPRPHYAGHFNRCQTRPISRRAHKTVIRAAGESFDVRLYHEASISEVRSADKYGHVIFLRLKDGQNSILPVYIGEYECGSLVKEINKKPTNRPGTHDLMKHMLDALGYRVTKVRITALVGNTYHARVHLGRGRGIKASTNAMGDTDIDIDARPSDAINLAVRFGAMIYVNKEVASKMAHIPHTPELTISGVDHHGANTSDGNESAQEIVNSCREEITHYSDPTIMYKLHLQLAIAEERFEDATKLRDVIDKALASDRALSLVVAIETALEDHRYEEAARLRDEFRMLRESHAQGLQGAGGSGSTSSPSKMTDISFQSE